MTKETVDEFVERLMTIENEKRLLAEDRKLLFEEYKQKLDLKAIKAALQIVKIRSKLESTSEAECDTLVERFDGVYS